MQGETFMKYTKNTVSLFEDKYGLSPVV